MKETDDTDSFNQSYTAIPKSEFSADQVAADPDLATSSMEFGKMNLKDAKEAGYTDKRGHAIELAREDVAGSPTGALTDIGAGHSSAVRPHH